MLEPLTLIVVLVYFRMKALLRRNRRQNEGLSACTTPPLLRDGLYSAGIPNETREFPLALLRPMLGRAFSPPESAVQYR